MKSFLFRFIIFIVFTCFSYVIFLAFVGRYAPVAFRKNLKYEKGGYGFTYSRLTDVEKVEDIDILFLGSSHAYRGFDTRLFFKEGYTAFNLGSSAQTPLQTEFLLKTHLNRLNPKIIVYDVYPKIMMNNGIESSLDILSNTQSINLHAAKMAIQVNNMKVYNYLVYSIIEKALFKAKKIKDKGSSNDIYVVKQGYVERKLSYNNKFDFKPNTWQLPDKQLKSFQRILDIINNRNTKLLLVQTPITKSSYNSVTNTEEIDTYFNKAGKYINFNNKIKLNDTLDFYDSSHLNQNGVNKFNDTLVKIIDNILKFEK